MNFNFLNKKVIIFGLGNYKYGSGISAAKFFIRHGAKVLITDLKSEKVLQQQVNRIKLFAKKYKNVPKFIMGEHRISDFRNTDIIIRNPGVPASNKYLVVARNARRVIHTDISLFLKLLQLTAYNEWPKIIGITGTRGKSTVSAVLTNILKKAGKTVFLGGNLGYSPLNFIDKLERVRAQGQVYVVLEMSSWMTESLDVFKISPQYAAITNFYPDHLNTYISMSEYINAKATIFKYQKNNDTLFLNRGNTLTKNLAKRAKAKIVWFASSDLKKDFENLPGEHNRENISAVLTISKILGVNHKIAIKAIRNFKGLPGRLEFIRELRGVMFYNDTTSTMPEATIAALRALGRQRAKNIVLIAGGADKGLEYTELAKEILKYIKVLILFKGKASDKLLKALRMNENERENLQKKFAGSKFLLIDSISDMHKVVSSAWKSAKRGDIILLSPGAASFNIFNNEFDRGDQFVKSVKLLK